MHSLKRCLINNWRMPIANISVLNNRFHNLQHCRFIIPIMKLRDKAGKEIATEDKTLKLCSSHSNLLEAHFHGVETYGKLNISCPFDVHIRPLNEVKYPEMNKCFIKLYYKDKNMADIDALTLNSLKNCYDFMIDVEEQCNVNIIGEFKTAVEVPILCRIEVPLKFDVYVHSNSNNVKIEKMECTTIDVDLHSNRNDQSPSSSCHLHNIKSGNVKVKCWKGDIISTKVLQGNADLVTTDKGHIKCERLQGQDIAIETEEGDITASSIYVQKSSFQSSFGNIKLQNCHSNNCQIQIESGDVIIGSFEGNLGANIGKGSLDLYMTRPEHVQMSTKSGSITIKMLDSVLPSFDLVGSSIQGEFIHDNHIQKHGSYEAYKTKEEKSKGSVKATTKNGAIVIEKQDWISSLKLKM